MICVFGEGEVFNEIKGDFYKCDSYISDVYDVVEFLGFFYVVFDCWYVRLWRVVDYDDFNSCFEIF